MGLWLFFFPRTNLAVASLRIVGRSSDIEADQTRLVVRVLFFLRERSVCRKLELVVQDRVVGDVACSEMYRYQKTA